MATSDDPAEPADSLADVRPILAAFYLALFRAEVGSRCHAFLEFVGVMQKYLDLVRELEAQGVVEPWQLNTHCAPDITVPDHHVRYLAEKIGCIFAPLVNADPATADILRRALFREAS